MRTNQETNVRRISLALLAASLAGLAAAALSGCDTNFADPTRFGPLRDQAPVAVLTGGGAGPLGGRYGEHVVGIATFVPHGRSPGVFLPASRIGVAGGESSPFFLFGGFDDGLVSGGAMTTGPHPSALARILEGCTDLQYCGAGSGRSITAMPSWSYEGTAVHGCIASPAGIVRQPPLPPNEMIQIRCETAPSTIGFVDVPDGIEFGRSSAPLAMTSTNGCPPLPHPVGAAVFGAPSDNMGEGGIYVVSPPPFGSVAAMDLGLTLARGDGLGQSLATSMRADGSVMVAASTLGATRRVVVFSLHADPGGGAPTSGVHACLTGAGAAFGHALVFGDLDGDGTDELIVGGADASPGAGVGAMADAPISIWDTEALVGLSGEGCAGGAPAPSADFELACPTRVPGLTCGTATAPANAGFGTSLAVGDVDGDRRLDLIAGAPLTGGGTGAVVVFRGATSLDALGMTVGYVISSTMRPGALLGTAVATIRGTDRDEIVAGAPGAGEVAVFFCSELDGDRAREAPYGSVRSCVRRVEGGPAPMCAAPTDAGPGRDAATDGSIDLGDAGDLDAGELDAGDPDAGDPDAGVGRLDAGDLDAGDIDADLDAP